MPVALTPLVDTPADRQRFVDFITAHEYPFHVNHTVSAERASAWADSALFDDDHVPYWIDVDGERIGLVVLEDVNDETPLFDVRLATEHRGRGHGVPVVAAVVTLVFTTMPNVSRFEGNTREDNLAMRRTFERCGFVHEAYYREAWPVPGGVPVGSVGYAILRRDWETGTTTPVNDRGRSTGLQRGGDGSVG